MLSTLLTPHAGVCMLTHYTEGEVYKDQRDHSIGLCVDYVNQYFTKEGNKMCDCRIVDERLQK